MRYLILLTTLTSTLYSMENQYQAASLPKKPTPLHKITTHQTTHFTDLFSFFDDQEILQENTPTPGTHELPAPHTNHSLIQARNQSDGKETCSKKLSASDYLAQQPFPAVALMQTIDELKKNRTLQFSSPGHEQAVLTHMLKTTIGAYRSRSNPSLSQSQQKNDDTPQYTKEALIQEIKQCTLLYGPLKTPLPDKNSHEHPEKNYEIKPTPSHSPLQVHEDNLRSQTPQPTMRGHNPTPLTEFKRSLSPIPTLKKNYDQN